MTGTALMMCMMKSRRNVPTEPRRLWAMDFENDGAGHKSDGLF